MYILRISISIHLLFFLIKYYSVKKVIHLNTYFDFRPNTIYITKIDDIRCTSIEKHE